MTLPKEFLIETENGEEFLVFNSIEYRTIRTMDEDSVIPVSARLELAGGSPVNMIDENTFLIVATQQRATRRQ